MVKKRHLCDPPAVPNNIPEQGFSPGYTFCAAGPVLLPDAGLP